MPDNWYLPLSLLQGFIYVKYIDSLIFVCHASYGILPHNWHAIRRGYVHITATYWHVSSSWYCLLFAVGLSMLILTLPHHHYSHPTFFPSFLVEALSFSRVLWVGGGSRTCDLRTSPQTKGIYHCLFFFAFHPAPFGGTPLLWEFLTLFV